MNIDIPDWLINDKNRKRALKNKKSIKVDYYAIIFYILMITLVVAVYLALETIDKYTDQLIAFEQQEILIEEEPPINEVLATITAYTSSVDETDDTPFITASGARTRDGIIACPPKYDFGTVIEINGKKYECQDRMNSRYHNQERFDIWVETKEEAFQWGVKKMQIVIWEMV